jgi:2-(3-amino-3-carboxypropyl)histidine synthase
MVETFDFEVQRVVSTIRQRGCRKVLLQFPEGLKRQADEVAAGLSEKVPECLIIVSGEPCFGACDIPDTDADLVVNFGHLPMPSVETPMPVLYIQARSSADPIPVLRKTFAVLPEKIGLVTTAQHLHTMPAIIEFLEKNKRSVRVGKGDGRIFSAGQVLGCNTSAARSIADDVEVFLFVGTGKFHPLAVALATGKDVIIADPVTGEVGDVIELREKVLRRRHGLIEVARSAQRFGVLLSTRVGQRRESVALGVEKALRSHGRFVIVIELDTVTPQKLEAFGLDCWVSTVCPRLAIDDQTMYSKPLITPVELEVALGVRPWEEYVFDEIFTF